MKHTIGSVTGVERKRTENVRYSDVAVGSAQQEHDGGFNTCLETEVVVDEGAIKDIAMGQIKIKLSEEVICEYIAKAIKTAILEGKIIKEKK